MIIDLTRLITSNIEELEVHGEVFVDPELIKSTSIIRLGNVSFDGEITKLYDNSYQITGLIKGIMVLPDDITLEEVEYSFESEIEEKFSEFLVNEENNLKIEQNNLDITEFLWQNILVEIPLKVRSDKNKDLTLEGDGWRLVTEDELKTSNNSPFSELSKMFDSRKE